MTDVDFGSEPWEIPPPAQAQSEVFKERLLKLTRASYNGIEGMSLCQAIEELGYITHPGMDYRAIAKGVSLESIDNLEPLEPGLLGIFGRTGTGTDHEQDLMLELNLQHMIPVIRNRPEDSYLVLCNDPCMARSYRALIADEPNRWEGTPEGRTYDFDVPVYVFTDTVPTCIDLSQGQRTHRS